MKKIILLSIFVFSFLFANDKTIIIGVTPDPFAILMEGLKQDFKAKGGYELKIVEFTDYILPNKALENKELDANLYQHKPFLKEYNRVRNAKLIPLSPILIAPMGIYSKKNKNLKDLKEGATIAIPNDPTNESRALELLEKAGLIKLDDKNLKTPLDIVYNPKKIKFAELKAAQLPRALDDVDFAAINSNYALALEDGLNPAKDAIFRENKNSSYVNYVVIRKEDKNNAKAKVIDEILRSQKVKDFINNNYKDVFISAF